MAITKTSLSDAGTLIRAVLIVSLIGALAGVAIGWKLEPAKLAEAERFYAIGYTVGRVLDGLGIDRLPSGRAIDQVTTYRTIKQAYPATAQHIEAATFAALAWPWPVLGLLAGLGALTMFSRINDFMNKREKS